MHENCYPVYTSVYNANFGNLLNKQIHFHLKRKKRVELGVDDSQAGIGCIPYINCCKCYINVLCAWSHTRKIFLSNTFFFFSNSLY